MLETRVKKITAPPHLVRMAGIKKSPSVKPGQGVEKRGPSHTVGGNVNWRSHCGEQCGSSKTKNRATM